MGDLEQAIFWRRRTELPLDERIYRFAEALLAVKELEYFRAAKNGPLPDRIGELRDHILKGVETKHQLEGSKLSVPERVKAARKHILTKRAEAETAGHADATLDDDLEDLFLVVQSFSYPGDYVQEKPTIERLAETLDKFEEDVLQRDTATIKAKRSAKVQFGEPVEVVGDKKVKGQTTSLTTAVESRVQAMFDQA